MKLINFILNINIFISKIWPSLLAVSLVLVGITGLPRLFVNTFFSSKCCLAIIAGISSIFINIIRNILNDDFNKNNMKNIILFFFSGFIICMFMQIVVLPYLKNFIIYLFNKFLPGLLVMLFVLLDNIFILINLTFASFTRLHLLYPENHNITKVKNTNKNIKNIKVSKYKSITALFSSPPRDPSTEDPSTEDPSTNKEESSNTDRRSTNIPTSSEVHTFTRSDNTTARVPSFRINMNTPSSSNVNTSSNVPVRPATSNTNELMDSNTNIPQESVRDVNRKRKTEVVTDTRLTTSSKKPFASSSNYDSSMVPFASSSNNSLDLMNRSFNKDSNLHNKFIDVNNSKFMDNLQNKRLEIIKKTVENNRASLSKLQEKSSTQLEIFYGNFLEQSSKLCDWVIYSGTLSKLHFNEYGITKLINDKLIYANIIITPESVAKIDPVVSSINGDKITLTKGKNPPITISIENYKILYEVILQYEFITYLNDMNSSSKDGINKLQSYLSNRVTDIDPEYINQILRGMYYMTKTNLNERIFVKLPFDANNLRDILDIINVLNKELEIIARRSIMDIRGPGSVVGDFDKDMTDKHWLADILNKYYGISGQINLFGDPLKIDLFEGMRNLRK